MFFPLLNLISLSLIYLHSESSTKKLIQLQILQIGGFSLVKNLEFYYDSNLQIIFILEYEII